MVFSVNTGMHYTIAIPVIIGVRHMVLILTLHCHTLSLTGVGHSEKQK